MRSSLEQERPVRVFFRYAQLPHFGERSSRSVIRRQRVGFLTPESIVRVVKVVMRERLAIGLLEDRSLGRPPGHRMKIPVDVERIIQGGKRLGGGELPLGIARVACCEPGWNLFEECRHV